VAPFASPSACPVAWDCCKGTQEPAHPNSRLVLSLKTRWAKEKEVGLHPPSNNRARNPTREDDLRLSDPVRPRGPDVMTSTKITISRVLSELSKVSAGRASSKRADLFLPSTGFLTEPFPGGSGKQRSAARKLGDFFRRYV
jgi:hypothetical protein